jgi:hypothetical protein
MSLELSSFTHLDLQAVKIMVTYVAESWVEKINFGEICKPK